MKYSLTALALIGVASLATQVVAAPFQLALWPNAQLVKEADSVKGVRLQIYGRNLNMSGVDIGIANDTQGDFNGLGVGILNFVGGDSTGVQIGIYGYNDVKGSAVGWNSATFAALVGEDLTGFGGGLFSRVGGDASGWQYGAVALAGGDVTGLQSGLIYSKAGGQVSGVQLGIWNRTGAVKGVQLGIVNIADDAYGVQIGLWNWIASKEKLKGFPIANGKF